MLIRVFISALTRKKNKNKKSIVTLKSATETTMQQFLNRIAWNSTSYFYAWITYFVMEMAYTKISCRGENLNSGFQTIVKKNIEIVFIKETIFPGY